ncbi:aldo/keto reductase [Streptomyces sp. NPDC001070]
MLREAVEPGVTHIDTSDFYGPAVVDELIKEALHPYPAGLRIAAKVGARRGQDGSWIPSPEPADLRVQVRENLRRLGLDALDVVPLRPGSVEGASDDSLAAEFGTLAGLRAGTDPPPRAQRCLRRPAHRGADHRHRRGGAEPVVPPGGADQPGSPARTATDLRLVFPLRPSGPRTGTRRARRAQ